MRNQARIAPIIKLLVSSGKFEAEWLNGWKKRPDMRLSQYLINEGIVEEDRNIYNFYDECGVTMEKLGFQRRDFAIRGGYGKDGKGELEYKVIKDMSNEHIANVVKHIRDEIERHQSLGVVEKILEGGQKYSENQLKKREDELAYRAENNINIED